MAIAARLEEQQALDRLVPPLQRLARAVPRPVRDIMHGVWLGHPLHPVLVQVPVGSWLSATLLDVRNDSEGQKAARWLTLVGLAAAVPAAATGATDWAELHEQQMRVGVVHAAANWLGIGCFATALACRDAGRRRAARLCGLAAIGAGGLLGGHLSFRQAAGANHAEAIPHVVQPGWHYLMTEAEAEEGKLVRRMLGETPVVVVRQRGNLHVLADRCSHLAGPLSDGELTADQLRCPWHGSAFRLADGSVAGGPATAPQPRFETRVVGGAIQVLLPGAG